MQLIGIIPGGTNERPGSSLVNGPGIAVRLIKGSMMKWFHLIGEFPAKEVAFYYFNSFEIM